MVCWFPKIMQKAGPSMSQHNVKLILSDIDKTILPSGKRCVSDRMIAAFHAAHAAGIHAGPASGRGISHVAPAFGGDAACVATALGTNGMQVYLDGELICEKRLPLDACAQVLDVIRPLPHAGVIVFDDSGRPSLVDGSREALGKAFPLYAKEALDAEGLPDQPPIKLNVFVDGDLEATREVMELLQREVPALDFNLPLAGFINLTPPGWSKASGIDVLCEALGIGLDQVVVFGDGGNDVEMLAHTPHGVAVEGSAPEAAAAAHWHIGRCEDDAVAAAIEALAAGEWPFTA